MGMSEEILNAMDSPAQLEKLFRRSPQEFAEHFSSVYAKHEDSKVLQVWRERLFYREEAEAKATSGERWRIGDVLGVVILSLLAGTIAKAPAFFKHLNEDFFYSRDLAFIVAGAVTIYFLVRSARSWRLTCVVLGLFAGSLVYLNLLPDRRDSQTILLACFHMPFFLWSLLGVAFLGDDWRRAGRRMDYIRYNGEALIYTALLLIGGVVLTGVTLGLFALIKLPIEEFYLRYVVVYGAVACPIVATYVVDRVSENKAPIARILAKLFSPLFLVTVLVYLLAMGIQRKSPYTDRDFLIGFNVLLLIVLGLAVFSTLERGDAGKRSLGDFVNLALVLATLVLDLIALSAILFRLASYGFTPNRMAVLGANLVVFVHLAGISYRYLRFILSRGEIKDVEAWMTRYLPVYTVWSVVVTFAFPLIYRFK